MDDVWKYKARLAPICEKWRIREFAVFGTAARGELRRGSDVDALVSFDPEVELDLIDILHLQDELEALFGRKVDLVEREAIETSDNWLVKREILGSAEPLYATNRNRC
ncbi:MAG TPA: nucleotidyltransferase domain-containing protein [Armatimonadota bacterium]|nr:nucleotidyltransferase domain-containing protein [Armatimonadota bacterium]